MIGTNMKDPNTKCYCSIKIKSVTIFSKKTLASQRIHLSRIENNDLKHTY